MARRRRLLAPLLLLLLLLGLTGGGVVLVLRGGDGAGAGAAGGQTAGAGAGERGDDAASERRGRVHVRPGAGSSGEGGAAVPTGEDAAGPQDGAEAGDDPGTGPADGAVPGEDDRTLVRGRVLDDETGEGLADARILVVRRDHGWNGSRTAADGTFTGSVPLDTGDGSPVEIRVGKPGHRTVIVPWSGGPLEVRLIPLAEPLLPGVVLGLATGPDGKPLTGRLLLNGYDEMGDYHGLWTIGDAAGAFRLEGLAPGYWQMRLEGGARGVEAIVPDGGTARIHVVGGAEPWPGTMTEEEYAARHRELTTGRPPGTTDDELGREQGEAERWRRSLAIQDIESRWRGIAPAREVVVSGLPSDGVAYVRAATTQGPHQSWRVRVTDGSARFPALTYEPWRLVLERPGAGPAQMSITVAAGDAPLAVAWK